MSLTFFSKKFTFYRLVLSLSRSPLCTSWTLPQTEQDSLIWNLPGIIWWIGSRWLLVLDALAAICGDHFATIARGTIIFQLVSSMNWLQEKKNDNAEGIDESGNCEFMFYAFFDSLPFAFGWSFSDDFTEDLLNPQSFLSCNTVLSNFLCSNHFLHFFLQLPISASKQKSYIPTLCLQRWRIGQKIAMESFGNVRTWVLFHPLESATWDKLLERLTGSTLATSGALRGPDGGALRVLHMPSSLSRSWPQRLGVQVRWSLRKTHTRKKLWRFWEAVQQSRNTTLPSPFASFHQHALHKCLSEREREKQGILRLGTGLRDTPGWGGEELAHMNHFPPKSSISAHKKPLFGSFRWWK